MQVITVNKCDLICKPMYHHLHHLSYTQSGYGSKLPTPYMMRYNGRLHRIYSICYSNVSTEYISVNGKRIYIDIIDAANKSAGKANIARTVKAILRNAKKITVTRYDCLFTSGESQYATDGPRMVRLKGTKRLDMPTKESEKRFEQVLAYAKSDVSITLPEKSILKTLISITPKSETALFPLENGAKVNAKYLLELLNLFDGDNDYYAYMADASTPLYLRSKDADESIVAVMMPCRTKA